jgi:hypothetical protein
MEMTCPPHKFTDGGAIIFCSQCGTQIRKISEDSNSEMDSIDELLKSLEQPPDANVSSEQPSQGGLAHVLYLYLRLSSSTA